MLGHSNGRVSTARLSARFSENRDALVGGAVDTVVVMATTLLAMMIFRPDIGQGRALSIPLIRRGAVPDTVRVPEQPSLGSGDYLG